MNAANANHWKIDVDRPNKLAVANNLIIENGSEMELVGKNGKRRQTAILLPRASGRISSLATRDAVSSSQSRMVLTYSAAFELTSSRRKGTVRSFGKVCVSRPWSCSFLKSEMTHS